jgi:hypothetical protein
MHFAILALIAALFSIPRLAHEQAPATIDLDLDFPKVSFYMPLQEPSKATEPIQEFPAVLQRIAACESQDKHFDSKGGVLKGGGNKYDIGKYQINVLYWGDLADELGHDIYTENGNEAMALEIYKRHGTAPWKWSKACWNK